VPTIHLKDIIGQRPTAAETKDIRQKRVDKFDNKPSDNKPLVKKSLLAIDEEPFNLPKISEEDMKKYREQTAQNRQAEEKQAEEPSEPTSKGVEGYDDFVKYIGNPKTYNWNLANILIKNGITDPKTGNGFYVSKIKGTDKQVAKMHGSTKTLDKNYLSGLLMKKYNEGLIKNYLN
jgi:hypothetical protein